MLFRYLDNQISDIIKKNYSVLILGPRQTGKTTLVKEALKTIKNISEYPLQNPSIRLELEAQPSKLISQVEALKNHPYIFIDEAQKIPAIFDAVQYLIDNKTAAFILTGSSARKLKRTGANLLPGRIIKHHLDPLMWGELGLIKENNIDVLSINNINKSVNYTFEESMVYGALPGIATLPKTDRESFLKTYSDTYLEEEIRAEALSRKIGAFSRFLELAAIESGSSPNLTKLSNETGISQPAIKEFYNVLVDTLIVERVEPYLKNARKRILSSPRYYFFDIGVRNSLARLPLENKLLNAQKGILFEHAVMLEIIRRIRVLNKNYRVCYWRTSAGAEVDCVIDMGDKIIPIEIKGTANVGLSDVKGLRNFINDYSGLVEQGFVIKMSGKKEKLDDKIMAIPWFEM